MSKIYFDLIKRDILKVKSSVKISFINNDELLDTKEFIDAARRLADFSKEYLEVMIEENKPKKEGSSNG